MKRIELNGYIIRLIQKRLLFNHYFNYFHFCNMTIMYAYIQGRIQTICLMETTK